MAYRNVVLVISQSEMDAYVGPFNYITHYEVYKPDLTVKDVEEFMKTPQAPHILLAICNAVFDPIGWVTHYTIKLKLLMRTTLLQHDRSEVN